MKKIFITGALVLGLALALPAQQATANDWVESHSSTKLADLTIGDLKALADQQSVQMQKNHYVASASIASYLAPGWGQFKTGNAVGGGLFLVGDLALMAGTMYGAYTLAPADVVATGLTMKARHALIENYCVFAPRVTWMHCDFFTRRSTVLFDCVAVYLAYAEDLVKTELVRFRITDDGFTVRDEAGAFTARVAVSWRDLASFHDHLTARLLGSAAE